MQQAMARGAGALALALVCACGSGEGSGPQQQSMVPQRASDAKRANNRAPVLSRVSLSPARPKPGGAIQAVVDARDPDGDALRFSYVWMVNGRTVPASGATLPAGSAQRDDRVEVRVLATDGLLESEEFLARATVEAGAPTLHAVSFDPPEGVKPGDAVSALVDASVADDARLRLEYRWSVNGEETRQRERTFDTSELHRGDRLRVRVTAYDDDAASTEMVSPELVLANSPPEIAGIPKPERDGDAFRYQFEAKDPDGDRSLRYALSAAPPGMTIDPIYGVATWRPTQEQAGKHVIEVMVTDNHGDGSKLRFEVDVTATVTPPPGAAGAGKPAAPAPPAAPAATD
jgi:hypothetical protein